MTATETAETAAQSAETEADAALRGRVEQVVADQVRPFLRAAGGDVTVLALSGGAVWVRLTGACGGCPMAYATLTGVIEKRLKEALPELRRVTLA